MLKTSVHVVDVPVENIGTILFVVHVVQRHRQVRLLEHRRLIHVNPEVVQIVCVVEGTRLHPLLPELLRVFIEKVNPKRLARPTLPNERLSIQALYENTGHVSIVLRLNLGWLLVVSTVLLHSRGIDLVVGVLLDVRVSYHHQAAATPFNLRVHYLHLVTRKGVLVPREVLLLIGVFNVHPEHVYLEPMNIKQFVALPHNLSRRLFPLGEMEAQTESRRKVSIPGDIRQALLHVKWRALLM